MAATILSELFIYDPTSKSGMRWNVRRQGVAIGDEAGFIHQPTKSQPARWRVRVDGKRHYVHRIVWEIAHGRQLSREDQIDHIDGNSLNNSIENLRLATAAINARNARMLSNNTTGVPGVAFKSRDNCYVASFQQLDGRRIEKYFSIARYGKQQALEIAAKWRAEKMHWLNSQGAGYTERHLSGG